MSVAVLRAFFGSFWNVSVDAPVSVLSELLEMTLGL